MAYTPGFLYDIYISHAPEDDEGGLLSIFKGWVETLEEHLKTELNKRLGEAVSIRRSKGASEFSILHEANKVVIKRSAVFLAVTSASYSKSDECRQELTEFEDDHTKELGKFILGNRRVFYAHIEQFNPLRFTNIGFNFYNDHGMPLRPEIDTTSFKDRLNELADAIEKILRSLKHDSVISKDSPHDIFSLWPTDDANAPSAKDKASPLAKLGFFRPLKDDSKASASEKKSSSPASDIFSRLLIDDSSALSTENEISQSRPLIQRTGRNLSSEAGLVFICYAREDEKFVLKLATTLKKRGVRVWIDQWDIPAGADWDLSIDEGLSKCDRLLVVLSPSSVSSDEVRSEPAL